MRYRTLIVDDEVKALERMEKLCRRCAELKIVQVFTSPIDALEFTKTNQIDLAFLDIEMPESSGLKLAERIQEYQPQVDVIFVTAYDKYALTAFEVNAVGYLLKPISFTDLQQLVCRIRKKREIRTTTNQDSKMTIQCLGGFFVYENQITREPMKWRTSKAEELFALLIHNHGQALSKDRIIDLLWGDMEYEKASQNLHVTSYYIREALQKIGYADIFVRNRGMYQLNTKMLDIDVVNLTEILSYMPLRELTDEKIMVAMKLAVGRYFEGKNYNWSASMDAWIQNKLDDLVIIQAKRFLEKKEEEDAINVLINAVHRSLCHEAAYKLLIQTYLDQGNKSAAHKYYQTYVENMREELDTEPNHEIEKLFDTFN